MCIVASVDTVARLTTNNAERSSTADLDQLLPNREGNAFATPAVEWNLHNHGNVKIQMKS